MKIRLQHRKWFLLALVCLCLFCFPARAEEAEEAETAGIRAYGTGYEDFSFLFDGDDRSYFASEGSVELTIESDTPFAGLYLKLDAPCGAYEITVSGSGETLTAGTAGFLHEYVALSETSSVTICWDGAVSLSEIMLLPGGELPADVQVWQEPLEGAADLLLLVAQPGDDQLFFAGLLPLYAARGVGVQVVYLSDARNLTNLRVHEALDGLWASGITVYPVFGEFETFLTDDLDATYARLENLGHSRKELEEFVVENLRRFCAQVVVTHGESGEYGCGLSMVCADLAKASVSLASDAEFGIASAETYGLWQVSKLYLLDAQSPDVLLPLDEPLDELGGLTPFAVSQALAYPCHISQKWTWYPEWLNSSSTAAGLESWRTDCYALAFSAVGEDAGGNDLLENIAELHADRLAREEAARLEQERLEQEQLEQERMEQERLEQEQLEKERLEQEQLEREASIAAAAAAAQESRDSLAPLVALLALLVLLLLAAVAALCRRRKR
ncbi:MAG: hypothetical protein LUH51_04295 [Firmicutes bacterium]|nr:hypothetical protein [Bacillota bacterium]